METRFYLTDGVLCRERPLRCPESYRPRVGVWGDYPDFKPHDARAISRPEAAELLPAGHPISRLDDPGEQDHAGATL